MVSSIDANTTIEVGLAWGVSALFICDALASKDNVRHILIDPGQYDTWKDVGLQNLRKAGFAERIDFHSNYSHRVLPKLETQQQKVDFAFIDGWHTFDYTLVDFFYIDKMLRVGGLVVFHDVEWPSIHKVCRYIATNYPYTIHGRVEDKKSAPSLKRRLLNMGLSMPTIKTHLTRLLRSEIIATDQSMGIYGSCICFRKKSDDFRKWDFHSQF